jgi:hypothetical protein
MARTLYAFLIPEAELRQLIEMCCTIGLEPQAFEDFQASCDSETLSRWVEEEWIEQESAEALRDIYRHAVRALRQNWQRPAPDDIKLAVDPGANWPGLDQVQMRREDTDDGKVEASVLDLQNAMRTELITLLREHAGDLFLEIPLSSAAEATIAEYFHGHTFFVHERLNAARRLGPSPRALQFSFALPMEIFAHSFYGIPELKKRADSELRAPNQSTEMPPEIPAETRPMLAEMDAETTTDAKEMWLSLIEFVDLVKQASDQRLAWIGHITRPVSR